MKAALALLFAACSVDAPSLDRLYSCAAVFVCDDKPYDITSSLGCAGSLDEAYDAYASRLIEITAGAQCSSRHFEPSCENTKKLCLE